MKANRNSFQAKTMTKTATAIMPCADERQDHVARMIWRAWRRRSIAASSSSRGIWSMKVRITMVPSETKKVA